MIEDEDLGLCTWYRAKSVVKKVALVFKDNRNARGHK